MIRLRLLLALVAVVALAGCSLTQGDSDDFKVSDAWARPVNLPDILGTPEPGGTMEVLDNNMGDSSIAIGSGPGMADMTGEVGDSTAMGMPVATEDGMTIMAPPGSEETVTVQIEPMTSVTGVFMVIENKTDKVERLVSASTDIADTVEIHETVIENEVAQMRPVTGVEIPAKSSVELKPGGLHIMLMNLQESLVVGGKFDLTLKFESGKEITVEVKVREMTGE